MANRQADVCPGCSRHCAASNVHCKYGQRYFEKMQKTEAAETLCAQEKDTKKHRRKWEKRVKEGGLTWKLLWVGSQSKQALRRKKLTEHELMATLNETEQAQLDALLGKISGIFG